MAQWTGIGAGLRQAELDQQATELHNLAMQKERVGLAASLMTLNQQAQMLKAMQGPGDGPPSPDALASNMDRMAAAAIQTGQFDKAEKYATTGTTIRKNQAEIKEKQTETAVRDLSMLSSILNNPLKPVNDEESWQQANVAFQLQTGKPSPFAQVPYDPLTVGRLQVGVQSAKDMALIESRKAATASAKAMEKEHEARLPLIKAQTRVAEERANNLAKVGSALKPPTANQLRAVTDLLVQDFGGSLPPEDLRFYGRKPAERVVELMVMEKMPLSAASNQAYTEAKERGDFGGIRLRPAQGGTLRKPLPIPFIKDSTGKLVPDVAKMKPNLIYTGTGKYEGKPLLFTGTGLKPATPAPVADDELEDDEGEE